MNDKRKPSVEAIEAAVGAYRPGGEEETGDSSDDATAYVI
jgi:hypothetical protein